MAGLGPEIGRFIFGPMLVGVFLNCTLYGTMVVQTVLYFETCKSDARWIKMFVLYLFVLETLNTGCDMAMMYEPLVTLNGTLDAVVFAPTMLAANPLLTVMISTPVQLFVAWRVKVMGRSGVLPAIIGFFAVASFVGGLATAISVCIARFEYVRIHKLDGVAVTWLASSAIADVIITASLVYNLMSRRTGFAATDNVINRVVRLTVQTGLITAVSAMIDVTLPGIVQNTTLNFIWDFALSKLYSNSLLSTLNARGKWRTKPFFRDNILFGSETVGEGAARGRPQVLPQVEIVRNIDEAIPMKAFDSGVGYYHEGSASTINVGLPFKDHV